MKRSRPSQFRDRKKRRPESRSVAVDFGLGEDASSGDDSAPDDFFAAATNETKKSAAEDADEASGSASAAALRIEKAKDYLKKLMEASHNRLSIVF